MMIFKSCQSCLPPWHNKETKNTINDIDNNKKDVASPSQEPTPKIDNQRSRLWSEEKIQEEIDLWKLNNGDAKKLRQLKERLKDIQHHDWNDPHVAIAYMKGPDGMDKNCKQIERAMRKMIQWRRENNIDSILPPKGEGKGYQPNPLLLDYIPAAFLNEYDYDGDPVYVERGGAIDGQGLLKRFSRDELDKHTIWLREIQAGGEWVREYERRQGRRMNAMTVIYDLEGLNAQHLNPKVLAWFKDYIDMTIKYYPSPIKRVIVIRAPAVFRAVWKAVKPCFSKEFRDLMIFTEPDKHLEEIEKYMDLSILPPCINPNGKGVTAIGMPKRMDGGMIPEHVGSQGKGYIYDRIQHAEEDSTEGDSVPL